MEGYYAVGLGLLLAGIGYWHGRGNGVLVGIETTLKFLEEQKAIKVGVDRNGETTIDLPEPCKCDK